MIWLVVMGVMFGWLVNWALFFMINEHFDDFQTSKKTKQIMLCLSFVPFLSSVVVSVFVVFRFVKTFAFSRGDKNV